MSNVAEEVQKAQATIMKTVEAVREKCDEHGKVLDSVNIDGIQKAHDDLHESIKTLQDEHQKDAAEKQALQEAVEGLKKKLSRAAVSGGDENKGELSELDRKYRDEFIRYCRRGKSASLNDETIEQICGEIAQKTFFGQDESRIEMLKKDLVAGSGPDGGLWIRPQRATFMAERIFETSPLRAVANVVNTTSDAFEVVIDDEEAVTGGWVGETDSRSTTDTPQIGMITIPVHEQFAQPRATQKMLDDAGFNLEDWLSRKVVNRMSRFENTAFIRGDGSQKPRGILDYADATDVDTYERGNLGTLETATASVIGGDDLLKLQGSLKEAYQRNAVWGMKRATFSNSIITLTDDQGQYLFQTRFLNEQLRMELLGKPIIFMDDLDAVADDGIPVVYADFSESYTIVDRFGFRVIRDDVTEKPYVLFYTTKRVGGAVTGFDSLKRLRIKAA